MFLNLKILQRNNILHPNNTFAESDNFSLLCMWQYIIETCNTKKFDRSKHTVYHCTYVGTIHMIWTIRSNSHLYYMIFFVETCLCRENDGFARTFECEDGCGFNFPFFPGGWCGNYGNWLVGILPVFNYFGDILLLCSILADSPHVATI